MGKSMKFIDNSIIIKIKWKNHNGKLKELKPIRQMKNHQSMKVSLKTWKKNQRRVQNSNQ